MEDCSLSQITDEKMNFLGRSSLQIKDKLYQAEAGKMTAYSNLQTGETVEKTVLQDLQNNGV